MMKRYLLPLILLPCLLVLAACTDKKDDPNPPEPPAPTPVSRTVLVYMVADNSLGDSAFDVADIKEMTKAINEGALNGGRLLIYWNCVQTEGGIPPRIFEVTGEGIIELMRYPDDTSVYSVDPERVTQVMADIKTLAPADDYGLILWSHANGWLGAPATGDPSKYRAFGDDRGYHITLPSLARALEGERFSFIYFDCCLMGNVETIYELRHVTPVIAGAPTELGVEGMPYDLTLGYFFLPEPDVAGAARTTYEHYASTYSSCQLAVYSTAALDRLAAESRAVVQNAADPYPSGINRLQRYIKPTEYNWSVDMRQYYTELLDAPDSWREAFDATIIWAGSTPQAIGSFYVDAEHYSGLGSYAPHSESDLSYRGYDTLQWYKDVWAR